MPTKRDALAVIFPGTKNTQRLASFALLCALASPTRATTVADLATRYRSIITTPKGVSEADWQALQAYLGKRNLLRKYPGLRPKSVEAQDWLLADPNLPSGTGAEKEDTRAAIDLAVQLRMLWPRTYQRTWLGSLVSDVSPRIADFFREARRDHNPFLLSLEQRLLFAWTSLKFDGTFLTFVAAALPTLPQPVTLPAFEDSLRAAFPTFLESLRSQASGPNDTVILKKLLDISGRLKRTTTGRKATAGGVTEQTQRRLFEEVVYWRLEVLTDLGYLSKPDAAFYAYNYLAPLTDVIDNARDGLARFMDVEFFSHWTRAMKRRTCARVSTNHARELLIDANREHSNQLGYTGVDEGVIVANLILQRRNEDAVLEYRDAVDALLSSDPAYKVLTTIDRNRQLSAFKISRVAK